MANANLIKDVIALLKELDGDSSVPRNVKEKIKITISVLEKDCDIKLKVNKAQHELEEIEDDINLEPYTRTQIWNIVSLLEKIS